MKKKPMKTARAYEWTTNNELDYLRGLFSGAHFKGPGCIHRTELPLDKLLRNYIKSAERRQKWGTFGGVDPRVVIAEARTMLDKLSGRVNFFAQAHTVLV